jgi:Response regulators consisting of a CheY-like receiver domain and a winged-helix DNA-binding domain
VRLLVVDDNPVNQKLLFYSLKKHYDVAMANNGLEAVQKLNNEAFDAVLMDLSMPVMDGAEATLQIRKSDDPRIQNIPIIFVTTNDYDHERERCLSNGANEYLTKPIDIPALIETIDNYLPIR